MSYQPNDRGQGWATRNPTSEADRRQWRDADDELIRLAQIYQCILEDTQRGHAYRRVNGKWQVPYQEDGWTARALSSDWGHEARVVQPSGRQPLGTPKKYRVRAVEE